MTDIERAEWMGWCAYGAGGARTPKYNDLLLIAAYERGWDDADQFFNGGKDDDEDD